jgi:hypothetical protein
VHEHALALAQRAVAVERRPRRRVDDRHSGALLEGQALGQRDDVGGGDDDSRGVAAEVGPGHDALAHARGVDTVADGGDLARHLVADDARGLGRVGVEPHASEGVGEVHARRADVDAHLPGPGRGVGTLLDGQDLGAAVPCDDDGTHGGQP